MKNGGKSDYDIIILNKTLGHKFSFSNTFTHMSAYYASQSFLITRYNDNKVYMVKGNGFVN